MKKFYLKSSLAIAMCFVLTSFLHAQTNQYLHFDGTNDYVSVPNASATIAGSNAFSMTGWFYDDALTYGQGLMGFRATAGGFYLIELNSGAIECRMQNSAGTLASYQSPNGTIVPQQWQHFAFVYNGTSVRLYRNGVSIGSVAASGTISNAAIPFCIGLSPLSGQNFYYHGRIDEVTLWNKALTQAEIDTMRLHELTGSEPNLQLYYKFNQGVPGGNNTSITSLISTVNSPAYDGSLLNFALNGATSNFNGTLNVRFQAISFPQIPTKLTTSPPFQMGATASSGLPVSYTLLSGPATLSGDTLTLTGAGTISIRASQAGNASFDSATSIINSFVSVDPALNAPVVEARNPLNATNIYMPALSTVQMAAITSIAYPSLFNVQSVQFSISGQPLPMQDYGNGHYTAIWTPPAFGPYTLQITALSNFGTPTVVNVNFNVSQTFTDINNVPAFSGVWLSPDTSTAMRTADLPSYVGAFDTIIATLSVTCPPGGCGAWDRVASVDVQGADGQWFEVIRYITPYGVACSHKIDLADYMSLLQGKVTFRVNCSTLDNGYLYALKFDFKSGTPPHLYSKVTKVWKDIYPFGEYGNLQPVPQFNYTFPPFTVESKLKLISTGHAGPNNSGNAAEFYNATHNIWVNGANTFTQHNWTTCNPNPDACVGQLGTWYYARAGWCPGAIARYSDYDMSGFISSPTVGMQYLFYSGYVDQCSAVYPGCVTAGSCDCSDGLNPSLDVNCNLITYYDNGYALGIPEIKHINIAIYPNPSNGVFIMNSAEKLGKNYDVTIYNMVGGLVKHFNWHGENSVIDLSNVSKGVYTVRVASDQETEFRKVVIQ